MSNFGRPKTYKTAEELFEAAEEFFALCDATIINKGIAWKISRPKTLSWLNLALWVGKNYLQQLKEKKDFSGTVDYIRNVIENDVEEKALTWLYSPSASSFNLKNNFNWIEKSEIKTDVTMKDYTFTSNLDDK
jgi:hypothetical protein